MRRQIQGLHEAEAEEAIEEAYKKSEMLKSPQVAISIVQYVSPKVAILGEVQAPGSYELISPTDLLTAITMAGGATVDAGTSLRSPSQARACVNHSGSWRICLNTLRAKNGESLGSGTRPRISHNLLSS